MEKRNSQHVLFDQPTQANPVVFAPHHTTVHSVHKSDSLSQDSCPEVQRRFVAKVGVRSGVG